MTLSRMLRERWPMSKNDAVLTPGSLIRFRGERYRLLTVCSDYVVCINADSKKYEFLNIPMQEYLTGYGRGVITSLKTRDAFMSDDKLKNASGIAEDIEKMVLSNLRGNFEMLQGRYSIPGIEEMRNKYGISLPTVHSWIRKYLQAGRSPLGLVRKSGSGLAKGNTLDSSKNSRVSGPTPTAWGRSKARFDENMERNFQMALHLLKSGRRQP